MLNGGGGGGALLILFLIAIFIDDLSCNKNDIIEKNEIATNNPNLTNASFTADYSSPEDEQRLILGQALMKAIQENPNLLDIVKNECYKRFDGDVNVLMSSLASASVESNVKINGNSTNLSGSNNFGNVINNYISKNNFLNQKGKQIQSNSTATNSDFINLLKTTDPIVQVYFYERDKSKGINGVVIIPKFCIQSVTKEFIVINKDGSIGMIKGDVDPKENYFVISTNERSGAEWQKTIAEYQAQQKEIANIRPKLVPKTNTDGTSRVCLSNPIDGKNGSVIINSSQDFTLLTKNGHNSFETYNIANNLQNEVDKNNEDKYAVMYIDDDGCIVDEPNPYNPPTTTTPTLPLNPDDYPSKIQTFTSAKFPDMGVVREFVPIDEGAPDVLLYFLTLVNPTTLNDYSSGYLSVTTDGNDIYYLQSVLYVPLFGGWWHSGDGLDFVSLYVNWRDFNPPFSYEFFLPNSTIKKRLPWDPKITGWYRGLIAVEIDANGPTFKDATFKIKPKNKDYYISFQAHNILYKYSTDLIISNGIFDIREGSKTQANPKDMNKDCTETYRNVKMNFAYNLSD